MTEKMREVVSHRGRMCLEVGAGNLTWDSGLTVGSKGLEPTDRVVAAGAGSVGVTSFVGFFSMESSLQESGCG